MSNDDPDLKRRFQKLREHDRAQAPPFVVASRTPPLWRWAPLAFAPIAIVAWVLVVPDGIAPRTTRIHPSLPKSELGFLISPTHGNRGELPLPSGSSTWMH